MDWWCARAARPIAAGSLFDVLTPAQVSSLGEICAELLVGLEPKGGCGAVSDIESC